MAIPGETFLVLCTCPDQATAGRLARFAVEHRLAACANIIPGLQSVYRWQGQVETADEVLLLIKTTAAAYGALEQGLRREHPYELPEIIAVPIQQGLAGYLEWVHQNTSADA